MKKTFAVVGAILGVLVLVVVFQIFGFVGEAIEVVQEETSPRAVQEKYEWFKRTKAVLDAKVADIEVFRSQIEAVQRDYPDVTQRPRDVRISFNQWRREAVGIVASYNGLASQYNAQHAMWNYRFADFGKLPAGVADTLPREFGQYRYRF